MRDRAGPIGVNRLSVFVLTRSNRNRESFWGLAGIRMARP
jgi:hypothetical protein